MLSAEKEIQPAMDATRDDVPNLGSFGKVVTSIQGLQDRLETFSADDVGDAYDKTQTLLFHLSDLNEKLAAFAEIKGSMANVRQAIEQPLPDYSDIGQLDAAETSALITVAQASKLIPFPRINRSAETSAAQLGAGTDKAISTKIQAQDINASISSIGQNSETVDQGSSSEAINPPFLSSHPLIEITTDILLDRESNPQSEPAAQQANLSPTEARDPLPPSHSEVLLLDEPEIDVRGSGESECCDTSTQPPIPPSLPAAEPAENTLPSAETPDFDQRLLDDLIKNYGEFVVLCDSPRANEASAIPVANTIEISAAPTPIRSTETELETKHLPSLKRDGDLDRELKKIIKDYGEYDLYSRQSSINIKTGVIAAFLLLALIFSGFYYFSPRALNPQNSTGAQSRPPASGGSAELDRLAAPPTTTTNSGALQATENNARSKNRR